MFKKLTLATALIATLGTAHAYQAEVGATINLIDPDNGDTSTGFAIDGKYYFNPVQVKNNPLNEAAFLDRASNVNAAISYYDYDWYETTTFGAGIEYYVPNSDFYVGANIARTTEEEVGLPDYDLTTYGVEVGYLPAPGLLIAAGLKGYDNEYTDGVDPTLRAKYVTTIGANDVNLEAYAGFGDLDEFKVRADYYIDKTLSLGVDYYDNDLYDELGINAKKFITQQISVEGHVGFADEGNLFGIRGAYRF